MGTGTGDTVINKTQPPSLYGIPGQSGHCAHRPLELGGDHPAGLLSLGQMESQLSSCWSSSYPRDSTSPVTLWVNSRECLDAVTLSTPLKVFPPVLSVCWSSASPQKWTPQHSAGVLTLPPQFLLWKGPPSPVHGGPDTVGQARDSVAVTS